MRCSIAPYASRRNITKTRNLDLCCKVARVQPPMDVPVSGSHWAGFISLTGVCPFTLRFWDCTEIREVFRALSFPLLMACQTVKCKVLKVFWFSLRCRKNTDLFLTKYWLSALIWKIHPCPSFGLHFPLRPIARLKCKFEKKHLPSPSVVKGQWPCRPSARSFLVEPELGIKASQLHVSVLLIFFLADPLDLQSPLNKKWDKSDRHSLQNTFSLLFFKEKQTQIPGDLIENRGWPGAT